MIPASSPLPLQVDFVQSARTGDLFVVVDVSDKTSGYDDVRMCFYIFFGLTSVVSLLSLLSKRVV